MKKNLTLICLLSICCLSFSKATAQSTGFPKGSIQAEAFELLHTWVDTLLEYQMTSKDPHLDGGLMCPACARIHGRCGDAVLPILCVAQHTGETKYVDAAKRLMRWMDNVHMPDGSWMNDVHVSDWNGTTVFASIALVEALRHHGELLDDSTKTEWRKQLLKAGEFINGNRFIYSRKREGMRNMNVNYSASSTYALYAIGAECGRKDFQQKARETAADLIPYFTENNHFLYGEGPNIWTKTVNGCRPVDLLYNVEESLPNMVYYALEANDTTLLRHLKTSMDTHLEFMLPDGAWDNSWGTRSFKWTYWGGRTSDGFMGGYYALAHLNPAYAEAIGRNVKLLQKATHKGLLFGGMHYRSWGWAPCIHHTFGHAKALASFLNQPVKHLPEAKLPRDMAYGCKEMKDIRTWLVATQDWRASITGFDAEYKVKGTHPMGGVLSMLWHKNRGPVFAATMNKYTLIEAPNMQTYASEAYQMAGTPRIELMENETMYSNLDDLNTRIECKQEGKTTIFEICTHLVDSKQQAPKAGSDSVLLTYRIDDKIVDIQGQLPASLRDKGVRLVLPIIAAPEEQEKKTDKSLILNKISIHTNTKFKIATNQRGRIFNPVPGFTFIPMQISADDKGFIKAVIQSEN